MWFEHEATPHDVRFTAPKALDDFAVFITHNMVHGPFIPDDDIGVLNGLWWLDVRGKLGGKDLRWIVQRDPEIVFCEILLVSRQAASGQRNQMISGRISFRVFQVLIVNL